MSKWNEMETQAFLNGKKLPKEIQETNDNHEFLRDAATALYKAELVVNELKNKITNRVMNYENSKDAMCTTSLKNLNQEMPIIKKLLDTAFDTTLNGLIAKEEWETEAQMKERLEKDFKLPLKK